jgi:hypothetical protein
MIIRELPAHVYDEVLRGETARFTRNFPHGSTVVKLSVPDRSLTGGKVKVYFVADCHQPGPPETDREAHAFVARAFDSGRVDSERFVGEFWIDGGGDGAICVNVHEVRSTY